MSELLSVNGESIRVAVETLATCFTLLGLVSVLFGRDIGLVDEDGNPNFGNIATVMIPLLVLSMVASSFAYNSPEVWDTVDKVLLMGGVVGTLFHGGKRVFNRFLGGSED